MSPHSYTKPIQASDLVFPNPIQSNADLALFAQRLLRPHIGRGVRALFIFTVVESFVTLLICAFLIFKRRQSGKFWLFTKRTTTFGTFIVPNTVTVLVCGVAAYLVAGIIFTAVIIGYGYDETKPFMEWLWVVPGHWVILDLAAFYSVYGFILSCSPKSPLCNSPLWTSLKRRWLFFPLPTSPWLMNGLVLIVGPAFMTTWITLMSYAGTTWYSHSKPLVLSFMSKLDDITPGRMSDAVDPALVGDARVVWASVLEVTRYVQLGLTTADVLMVMNWLALLAYGMANQANLVLHAYDMYPHDVVPRSSPLKLPDKAGDGATPALPFFAADMDKAESLDEPHPTVWSKFVFIMTKGRPGNTSEAAFGSFESTAGEIYQRTWKMTIFCLCQASMMLGSLPLFMGAIKILLIWGWKALYVEADITYCMNVSFVYVAIISICTCTYLVAYSTVITLDPLFKAVLGIHNKPLAPATTHLCVAADQSGIELGTPSATSTQASKHMSSSGESTLSSKRLSVMSGAEADQPRMALKLEQTLPSSRQPETRLRTSSSASDNRFLITQPEPIYIARFNRSATEGLSVVTETITEFDDAERFSYCTTLPRDQ